MCSTYPTQCELEPPELGNKSISRDARVLLKPTKVAGSATSQMCLQRLVLSKIRLVICVEYHLESLLFYKSLFLNAPTGRRFSTPFALLFSSFLIIERI